MALISRDPFARQEMHRSREYVTSQACSWCGNVRRTPTGRTYLYAYRTETDGGRKYEHANRFCCLSCHNCYHGT